MTDKLIKNLYIKSIKSQEEISNKTMIHDVCLHFCTEQMKLINHYIKKVEDLRNERDFACKESLLVKEKLLLMNQISTEKDRIKEFLGNLGKIFY